MTSANAQNITGGESVIASYIPAVADDAATTEVNEAKPAILKLNGFSYEGEGYQNAAIYSEEDLTIELNENNAVAHTPVANMDSYGVFVNNHNLTITGDGSLSSDSGNATGNGNSYGIKSGGFVNIDSGCLVTATAGEGDDSVGLSFGDQLTVDGTLTAKGKSSALGQNDAAEYTVLEWQTVTESRNHDGTGAISVAVGSKKAKTSKYVKIETSPLKNITVLSGTKGAGSDFLCANLFDGDK